MKKVSEMNGTEIIAYRNIKGIFNWEVGGWYNCIQDNCIEYIPDTLEEAKEFVYECSLKDFSRPGMYSCGNAPKEMRFAGSEFIRSVIDHLFANDEDALEIAHVKNW